MLLSPFESQNRELSDMKKLVEKRMSLNKTLSEELEQARKKINDQAGEIVELYSLNDDLERHTRINALEICGKPEGEEAVLKVAGTLEVPMCEEDIEISHHLNRKGSEKGIRPIIGKFVIHKGKTRLYKSRVKLKNVRVGNLFPSCSAATPTEGGRIFSNEI